MSAVRVSERYAKSLINLAREQNALSPIHHDLKLLKEAIVSSSELRALLKSPIVKADKKTNIINGIFGSKVNAITAAFLNLIIKKGREQYLEQVVETGVNLYNQINNIKKVELITAAAVDDSVQKQILSMFNSSLGSANVDLETMVDEALIGGFKLHYEGKLIDASLKTELNELRQEFKDNSHIRKI